MPTTERVVKAENDDEWLVHGRRFDLSDFVARHPGGAHAIGLGKGRDCTHLVESYHPHSDKVWEVLAKYEVPEARKERLAAEAKAASASTSKNAAVVEWPPRDPFYEDIKKVVRKHFPNGPDDCKGTWEIWICLGLVGTIVFHALFYRAVTQGSTLFAFVAGAVFVVVNARFLHEGGHLGLSKHPWVNRAACLIWSIPTLCASTWELQHVISHHQYTNALPAPEPEPEPQLSGDSEGSESDNEATAKGGSDGSSAKPLHVTIGEKPVEQRTIPYDVDMSSFDDVAALARGMPRWAWPLVFTVAIPLIYAKSPATIGAGYCLSILMDDRVEQQKAHCRWDAALTLLVQVALLAYMSATHGVLRALAVWTAYLAGNGAIFITFSQVSHIPIMTQRWRTTVNDFANSWAAGQCEHSMNFAMGSKFAFYISFALNFQIEHHLLPSISHDHLPKLAPDIERVCKKHGVRYWHEPSLGAALNELWKAFIDLRDTKLVMAKQE